MRCPIVLVSFVRLALESAPHSCGQHAGLVPVPGRSQRITRRSTLGHEPPKPAAQPVAEHKPFISADQDIPEFTLKAILFGSIFGILFGASTVYLALKAGLTVSASIPIAVLSISVLRVFGRGDDPREQHRADDRLGRGVGRGGCRLHDPGAPVPLAGRQRRGVLPVLQIMMLAAVRRDPRRALHGAAAARADRRRARHAPLSRGHRLRGRPDRRREGRPAWRGSVFGGRGASPPSTRR